MPNARQRGTGVRVRSEAKAALADRLLMAAQEQAAVHDLVAAELDLLPFWRLGRRRTLAKRRVTCLERYMQAIREAQDVARKGRHVDVG